MSTNVNETQLRVAVDAWNSGHLDDYLTLYDDRIRLHGYSPEPMDKGSVRGFYQSIVTAFRNNRLEFHEVLWNASGDRCAIRFTMFGRHLGPFMGVAATGRDIALPGITILHFRDGRCVERWSSADMLSLLV